MNNVYLIDISLFIIFTLATILFLYIRRKNLKKEGILYLYRTNVGLKVINSLSKSCPKTLKVLSYFSVATGYILMAFAVYFIYQIITIFSKPELVQQIKIPPIMPLIPYLPELFKIDFLPPFYFSYWIIAIALVAIFHEASHGIFARYYNVGIKSTGFGFLGPLLAFFVEQDSNQMKKARIFPQLTILSAGVFANILLGGLILVFFAIFMSLAYNPAGVIFTDYTFAAVPASAILSASITGNLSVDGLNFSKISLNNKSYYINSEFYRLTNFSEDIAVKAYYDLPAIRSNMRGVIVGLNNQKINSIESLSNELSKYKPGDNIRVSTKFKNDSDSTVFVYDLILQSSPDNSSKGVLGIASSNPRSLGMFKNFLYKIYSLFANPLVYYEPVINNDLAVFIKNLLWWLVIINLSVAIMNMLPLGIFDGGMFFMLTILGITKNKKLAERCFKIATWIFLLAFIFVTLLWGFGIFFR